MMSRRRSAYPGHLSRWPSEVRPASAKNHDGRSSKRPACWVIGITSSPPILPRKLRSTIGLYLLDFRNEVYADVFRGVRDALER